LGDFCDANKCVHTQNAVDLYSEHSNLKNLTKNFLKKKIKKNQKKHLERFHMGETSPTQELHAAILAGDAAAARAAVARGADLVAAAPGTRLGALHAAAECGRPEVLAVVLRDFPLFLLDAPPENGGPPGAAGARAAPAYAGGSALHVAATWGHMACVDALLEAGCSPKVVNSAGHTPAHEAMARGHRSVATRLGWLDD
jgi:hypothetical protein